MKEKVGRRVLSLSKESETLEETAEGTEHPMFHRRTEMYSVCYERISAVCPVTRTMRI